MLVVHVAVPEVTEVVPQPVFALHVTVPVTTCGRPAVRLLRFFALPNASLIVAVKVTDCP
jgi:hypothetical protein